MSASFSNKAYWTCQIFGWSGLFLVNFFIQISRPNANMADEIFANVTFIFAGIFTSHGLRAIYRNIELVRKNLLQALLPTFGFSFLAAIVCVLIALSTIKLFSPWLSFDENPLSVDMVIGNIIGIFPMVIIWSCIYLAVHYLANWRVSEIEKLKLESALKDAQMNALLGQINPHFVFNALNNIRSLVAEDIERSRDAIGQLANLLRSSLNSGKQKLVPLDAELKLAHDFIELCRIQFEDKLSYLESIDKSLLTEQVPPFVLQMLFENAIKHGISEIKSGGQIELTIKELEKGFFEIKVANPVPETKRELTNSTKVGITNISERLSLQFEGQASIAVTESSNLFVVSIRLPLASVEKS